MPLARLWTLHNTLEIFFKLTKTTTSKSRIVTKLMERVVKSRIGRFGCVINRLSRVANGLLSNSPSRVVRIRPAAGLRPSPLVSFWPGRHRCCYLDLEGLASAHTCSFLFLSLWQHILLGAWPTSERRGNRGNRKPGTDGMFPLLLDCEFWTFGF